MGSLSIHYSIPIAKRISDGAACREWRTGLHKLAGKPITKTGIQLQLAKYYRQADIWVTCHQLRTLLMLKPRILAAGCS